MKKSLIALLISSALMLSACDDQVQQKLLEAEKKIVQLEADYKTAQANLTAKESELSQAQTALASKESEVTTLQAESAKLKQQGFPALQVEIVPVFEKSATIKHSKAKKEDFEPDESHVAVKVNTAKTGVEWLDNLLLQSLYKSYAPASESPNNQVQKEISYADFVKFLGERYQEAEKIAKEDKPRANDEYATTYYVGQRNHLATFTQFFLSDTGGAHGTYHTRYLNIDTEQQAVISLNDLVSPKNQDKLKELLWKAYVNSKAEEGVKEDELFMPKNDFFVSDNFYFSEEGITFVYPVYSLGPYAEGEGKLKVDYYELEKLINPNYFPTKKDGYGYILD